MAGKRLKTAALSATLSPFYDGCIRTETSLVVIVAHLLDVLPVRRWDHLRGQTLGRVHAFCQLLVDQMQRQRKLLSGQFPDVSYVAQLPENDINIDNNKKKKNGHRVT